jgi:alpha-glucosidase
MAQKNLNKSLSDLTGFHQTTNGISGDTSFGKFQVMIYTPNMVRIRISKDGDYENFSYAVIQDPENCNFKILDEPEAVIVSTDAVDLIISKNPVRFRFLNKKGEIINEDDAAFGTSWIGDQVTTYKKLQEGEKFVGLGEKTGNLNRRGEGYTNYNTDYFAYPTNADPIYATFPFYIGIHNNLAYGIFMDNSYKSHFNFGASNDRFSSFTAEEGEMNYYFIYHDQVKDIIRSYSDLTGRLEMPPLWSLGYQQCRYSYYPDTEILNIARNFRERKIPADVIYLDIHYMDKYKIFTWDKSRFPEPGKMLEELRAMGFHVVIIVDPGIKVEKGYQAYEEGVEKGLFVKYPDGTDYTGQVWPGWCHFPDYTNPDVREWWGKSFKGYVADGIDGYWNDMNEFATWGQRLPELMQFNYEGELSTTRRARNIYGMQMAKSTFEGTKKLLKGKRPFVLTRAGYSGVQRYSAVWTGDNIAEDDHMLLGVRLVNSLGLTGVAYAGYDVGGFVGDSNVDLYTRWLTIGAFAPFFRGHSNINTRDSEPWSYGEEAEEISRNYIQVRYKLMPYIYSAFYEATQNGMPVARSLVIDFTHDENVYNGLYQNQYLFGPAFLIAPVSAYKDLAKIYLPKGDWYYFFDSSYYEGGREIIIETPGRRLPVFVKASSIIPFQSPVQSMAEKPDGILQLHIYKGVDDNSFVYYEDDGESYEYLNENYFKRIITYNSSNNELVLGEVKGNMESKFIEIKLVLHSFGDVFNNLNVDGKKENVKKDLITFINSVSHFDPFGEGEKATEIPVQIIQFENSRNKITVKW